MNLNSEPAHMPKMPKEDVKKGVMPFIDYVKVSYK
jgi:hypothetical protein